MRSSPLACALYGSTASNSTFHIEFYYRPDGPWQAPTAAQQDIVHCIFSRHHDGFVRQAHALRIYTSVNPWVVPFVLLLIGEYVVDILADIERALGAMPLSLYRDVLRENPSFWTTTKQRVMSYWNCYYRTQYPKRTDYVGFRLLQRLQDLQQ